MNNYPRIISVVIILLSFNLLFCENEITSFIGGNHTFDLTFSNNIISGVDSRIASYGNANSSLIKSPSIINNNPASLGYFETEQIQIEFVPQIMGNLNDLYNGFQSEVNKAIDDGLQDMRAEGLEPVYPQIKISSGQPFHLNTLSFVMCLSKFGNLGISYNNALSISINGIVNGFSLKTSDITRVEETGNVHEEKTIIPLSIEALLGLKIGYKQFDLAWGKSFFNKKLSIGTGLNILSGRVQAEEETLIDGIIRQTGGASDITAAFNDPSDDFRNSMNISVESQFAKRLYRPQIGISYHPTNNYFFDLTFLSAGTMDMKGNLEIIQHQLGALNLNYDESAGEELFDLNQLKPSQITYTNQITYSSNFLRISYPGKVGFSAAFQKNWFNALISYEKPLDDFSLHYQCEVYEDGQEKVDKQFVHYADTTNKSYKVTHKSDHIIKFGMGLGFFSIGGQIMIGDILFEGFKDDSGNPKEDINNTIIGGALATNLDFKVSDNLRLNLGLIGLPGPLFRTNITYKF